jgi:hypothetical protein
MVAVVERRETKSLTVERGQEVVVRRKNDIGILFEISMLLSENDVNILGVSAGVCGEDCLIRLITDDHRKTKEVLAANNFRPEEEKVILVRLPHRPGTLKQMTKTLARQGIDLRHIYAAAGKEQGKCLLVFHSSNDESALAKLQEVSADSSEHLPSDQEQAERAVNMISEGGPIG